MRHVELEGRGRVLLTDEKHVATGGEASVYRDGDTAIKVYTDPGAMRTRVPVEKLQRLMRLRHDHIVAPQGVVRHNDTPVGYYMPFVDGMPLLQAFPTAFWQRSGFDMAQALRIVAQMRDIVQYAHDAGAVVADPNEMNWLLVGEGDDVQVYAIDVDAWGIKGFDAHVVAPSVRDYHAAAFTPASDWFGWAVVTFQLLTGIHPYKGVLSPYKRHDLEARMRDNASVFAPGVRLPSAVRPFAQIPSALLAYYQAVFQDGLRESPPMIGGTARTVSIAASVRVVPAVARGALTWRVVYDQQPIAHIYLGGLARTREGLLVDLATHDVLLRDVPADAAVVVRQSDSALVAVMDDGAPVLRVIRAHHKPQIAALHLQGVIRFVSAEGRLFAVTHRSLTEVQVLQMGRTLIATAGTAWPILPHALQWFDGVGVQDALGARHLVVPDVQKGCAMVRVPELDGARIVSVVRRNRVAVVTTVDHAGNYRRRVIVMDSKLKEYTIDVVADAEDGIVPHVVLPKGVVATIVEDGALEISVPSTGKRQRIRDGALRTDMRLAHNNNDVYVVTPDGVVQHITMTAQ